MLPSLLDTKHHFPKLRYAERAKGFGKNFQGGGIVWKGVQVCSPARFLYGVFGSTLPGFIFFFLAQIVLTRVWFKRFLPWHNVRVVYDRCNGGLLK